MKFDIQYLYSAKFAKGIIITLSALFSLLIVLEWASLFFNTVPTSTVTANNNTIETTKKVETIEAALNTPLFGVYVPDDLNEDNVKKTLLDVTLVGILLSEKTEESQVIIRSSSGEEKAYKINDTIPGGAIIKRIMAQGILVERDGSLERLALPKSKLNFEPVAKPLKEE